MASKCIIKDDLSMSKDYHCGICGMKVHSTLLLRVTKVFKRDFSCSKYERIIEEAMERKEHLCNEMEIQISHYVEKSILFS